MVVGLMGPGYFTNGGHFISLLTINKKGMVEVADVGSRVRSQKHMILLLLYRILK